MSLNKETMDLISGKAGFSNWSRGTYILADSRFANIEVAEQMFLLTSMWISLLNAP